jgi:hypothetical protein
LIYPNLGDDVSKAARDLGFFFTVYTAAGTPAPQAILELIQNGKPLAQVPLPLDAADASGQIQQVGRLPLEQIPAGTYELRVIVKACAGLWKFCGQRLPEEFFLADIRMADARQAFWLLSSLRLRRDFSCSPTRCILRARLRSCVPNISPSSMCLQFSCMARAIPLARTRRWSQRWP